MKWTIRALALILALLPAATAAQQFPTIPDKSVIGRIGTGTSSGPSQAIPFQTLVNNLPLSSQVEKIYTPEQFGAVGNGTSDDTAAWTQLCSAVQAAGGGHIIAGQGKTYKVWPIAPADQSVLCNLTGSSVSGVKIDMRGATINVAYTTGAAIIYVFEFAGGQHIEINDLVGISGAGKHVSGDTIGTNWVECSNQGGSGFGCRDLAVHRANITGGLNGVAITRAVGTGQWSWGIHADGTFTNVGYPFSNQFDGLNSDFDIVTINAGRSYIGYNVWGVRGRINATNTPSLNDIEVAAYGFQGELSGNVTANMDFVYVNRASTSFPSSPLSLSHQQADPNHSNIATTISNIHFNVDVNFGSSANSTLYVENSFTGNGTSESPGDPGNTNDNIVIEGKVDGSVLSTYLLYLLSASVPGGSSGYNGTSTGTYDIRNLQIPTAAQPITIGLSAKVSLTNVIAPSMNLPNYEASVDGGLIRMRNVLFANIPTTDPVDGPVSVYDPTGNKNGVNFLKGNEAVFFNTSGTENGVITAGPSSLFLTTQNSASLIFGFNSLSTPSFGLISATELQPNTDNALQWGDTTHRLSNVFSMAHVLGGSSSGNLTLQCAAICGTNTLTFPAGTTNFSATGPGAVVQSSSGAALTVSTLTPALGGTGLATLTAHGVLLGEGTSNIAFASPSTAGQVLTSLGASADPSFASVPSLWVGNAQSLSQNTQNFCGTASCSAGSTSTSFPVQKSGTFKNLVMYSATAPAAGQTYTVTIYEGGLLAVTCTISNPSTSCNDTTHTASHTAGNSFFFRVDLSATAGANSFAYGVELDTP